MTFLRCSKQVQMPVAQLFKILCTKHHNILVVNGVIQKRGHCETLHTYQLSANS